jgi:hypothetical protein
MFILRLGQFLFSDSFDQHIFMPPLNICDTRFKAYLIDAVLRQYNGTRNWVVNQNKFEIGMTLIIITNFYYIFIKSWSIVKMTIKNCSYDSYCIIVLNFNWFIH